MQDYGGVPWIENVITESDTDILLGSRDSRDLVASNILGDLTFARANINTNGDADSSIDTDVVNAFLSRVALVEGTWRKYHGLGVELTLFKKIITCFSINFILY